MKQFNLKIKRDPTKGEIRYVVDKILCLCIDYESLREFDDTERFYKDVKHVMFGEMAIDSFTSEYICDTIDDMAFDIPYQIYEYMKKKLII
jgi:hypothetical protein